MPEPVRNSVSIAAPVSTVDEECKPRPPWEIVSDPTWEPPPPAKDPVQVLLVDDTYRTGWTMTVAAALLREAGASEVMPLVVQQLP